MEGPSTEQLNQSAESIESEIMAKVVDVYKERDLKFKHLSLRDVESILENGVTTPFYDNRRKDDLKDNQSPLDKLRVIREEEKKFRTQKNLPYGYLHESHKFSNAANVYYPEGAINLVYSIIEGTFNMEDATMGKHKIYLRDVGITLRMFLEEFPEDKLNGVPRNLNVYNLLIRYLKDKGFLQKFETSRSAIKDKLSEEELDIFLKIMSENKELIREATIKHFLKFTGIRTGIIFGSNTEVSKSYDGDYPTQATIRDVNNKRHIIGLTVADGNGGISILRDSFFGGNEGRKYLRIIDGSYTHAAAEELKKIIKLDPEFRKIIKRNKLKVSEGVDALYIENMSDGISNYDWNYLVERAKELFLKMFKAEKETTVRDYYIRLGEKYKLPVYGEKGNLLWPKKMSQEEVAQLKNNL